MATRKRIPTHPRITCEAQCTRMYSECSGTESDGLDICHLDTNYSVTYQRRIDHKIRHMQVALEPEHVLRDWEGGYKQNNRASFETFFFRGVNFPDALTLQL